MPTTRAILAQLTRNELLGVVDAYDLDVSDRRVKDQLVDVLATSTHVVIADILSALRRDRLKALCLAFDLDGAGREKSVFVERLVDGALLSTDVMWRRLRPCR